MNSAARERRPSKNDVIVLGDDSESDQPAVKSAKWTTGPVSSSEVFKLQQQVVKLQEKLRKSEDNYKNLYQCAREARQRAEHAETQLIESQDEIERERESADELRTELAEVSTQLEKAIRTEKKIRNNSRELAREQEFLSAEVADLKRSIGQERKEFHVAEEKLQEKVTFLTNQLKRQRDRANEERMRDRARMADQDTKDFLAVDEKSQERTAQESKELAEVNEKLQERVKFLTHQLVGERNRANEDRAKDRTKIDELTYHLTQYEHWAHQQHYQYQLQYPAAAAGDWPELPTQPMEAAAAAAAESGGAGRLQSLLQMELQAPPVAPAPPPPPPPAPARIVRIYDKEHPTNILQLYRAGVLKSVGIDSAVWQLKSKADEIGDEKIQEYLRGRDYFDLDCEACGKKKIAKYFVLTHFLSQRHIEKVKSHGAAVSLPAYQFWFKMLQQAAAAPAGATTTAAAASSGVVGCPKVIVKKEEPET